MSASYPYPIIAREGWPFLAAAIVAASVAVWLIGWGSILFWLAALFILQFFRDPPREAPGDSIMAGLPPRRPGGVGRPAGGSFLFGAGSNGQVVASGSHV